MHLDILANGHTQAQYLRRDWGLSLLLERHILFDTYSHSKKLLAGLARVGVKPSQIDTVVISHDHWDHTGGLSGFVKARDRESSPPLRLYRPCDPFPGGEPVFELAPDIYLLREIPFSFKGGAFGERALLLKEPQGLRLVVGCAHPGIDRLVEAARAAMGAPVVSILGGIHLMHAKEEEIVRVVDQLKKLGVRQITPLHCTGHRASALLDEAFS